MYYYLPNLHSHDKWQRDKDQVQPDMIIMIVDPQLPRDLWPLERTTNVSLGLMNESKPLKS